MQSHGPDVLSRIAWIGNGFGDFLFLETEMNFLFILKDLFCFPLYEHKCPICFDVDEKALMSYAVGIRGEFSRLG